MQDSGVSPSAQPNSKSIVCVLVAGLISGLVKWSVYDEWCLGALKRRGDGRRLDQALSSKGGSERSQV